MENADNVSDEIEVNHTPETPTSATNIQRDQFQFKITPNPNEGLFDIQYNLEKQTNINIKLMSLDGQIVLEKSILNQSKGNHVEKINFGDFSAGVYICQISNQHGVYSQKIIKF